MSLSMPTVGHALNAAASYFQSGNLEQSQELCKQVLECDPSNADALQLMAFIAYQTGVHQEAIDLLGKAIEFKPDNFELHNNLGNILKALGQPEAACNCYLQAIAIDPTCFAALYNLGNVQTELRQFDKALTTYQQAIAVKADFPDAYYNFANAQKQAGLNEQAIESYKKAIALNPSHFDALVNLGNTLASLERFAEATLIYTQASNLRPDATEVFINLGVVLTKHGSYPEAKMLLKQALLLDEHNPITHNNLGVVQRLLGEIQEAINSFQLSIEGQPDYYEAYRNLGNSLAELGRDDEAVLAYSKALNLKPDFFEALLDLGASYINLSQTELADQTYRKALAIKPTSIAPLWGQVMASLPKFYSSEKEIAQAREKYSDKLDELASRIDLSNKVLMDEASSLVGSLQPFFLSCNGYNNRELQQKYGKLICQIMSFKYPQWSKAIPMPSLAQGEKIRVGFVSRHFHNHSDWRLLIGGWLKELDKDKFEIYGYSTGGIKDQITEIARNNCKTFVEGLGFTQLCQRIKNDNLHVLIYSETGQDPLSLQLATLRLAPVQCVAWGLPQTSGLSTLDYFLTSDLIEPEDADEHYSEKLVRLPNLSSYYVPSQVKAETYNLSSLGIKPEAVRYICAQSLFKYLPQYDDIFVEIVSKVKEAQLIFFSRPKALAARFKKRLEEVFSLRGLDASKHILLLPIVSHEEFVGVLKTGHAFLDSIDFSGCLTTLDAIEQALPIVTIEGSMMRGRQSAGMLRMLEIVDTIASTKQEYIDLAVKIGVNEHFRQGISKRLDDRRHLLYHDIKPIVALQDFIASCCVR